MRSLIILLVTLWLPTAFAHHHHGITLDPASSLASPHVATAGDGRLAAAVQPADPAAGHSAVQAAAPAAQGSERRSGALLLVTLLLAAVWVLWRLARR